MLVRVPLHFVSIRVIDEEFQKADTRYGIRAIKGRIWHKVFGGLRLLCCWSWLPAHRKRMFSGEGSLSLKLCHEHVKNVEGIKHIYFASETHSPSCELGFSFPSPFHFLPAFTFSFIPLVHTCWRLNGPFMDPMSILIHAPFFSVSNPYVLLFYGFFYHCFYIFWVNDS